MATAGPGKDRLVMGADFGMSPDRSVYTLRCRCGNLLGEWKTRPTREELQIEMDRHTCPTITESAEPRVGRITED